MSEIMTAKCSLSYGSLKLSVCMEVYLEAER